VNVVLFIGLSGSACESISLVLMSWCLGVEGL